MAGYGFCQDDNVCIVVEQVRTDLGQGIGLYSSGFSSGSIVISSHGGSRTLELPVLDDDMDRKTLGEAINDCSQCHSRVAMMICVYYYCSNADNLELLTHDEKQCRIEAKITKRTCSRWKMMICIQIPQGEARNAKRN